MYKVLVNIINYLIRIANTIRLAKCTEEGRCLCAHCTNSDCKVKHKIDELISE